MFIIVSKPNQPDQIANTFTEAEEMGSSQTFTVEDLPGKVYDEYVIQMTVRENGKVAAVFNLDFFETKEKAEKEADSIRALYALNGRPDLAEGIKVYGVPSDDEVIAPFDEAEGC